jgi:hypothetical protein
MARLKTGATKQFTCDVRNSDGNPVTVRKIWMVIPPAGGTITQNGLFIMGNRDCKVIVAVDPLTTQK